MKIIACTDSPRKEWNTAMQLKNAFDRLLQCSRIDGPLVFCRKFSQIERKKGG